ncbi:MAG TPA: alpha/beta fold hydrolase [Polyangiaceae bacterium]|nr:alpha/beta fold hydrolase [Polyangiaceae bacterium]
MQYLLLHGFTGTPASLSELNAPAGSLAPALAGHLQTPVVGGFEAEVERLAALAGERTGLFGYSLGGRLALGLLARYPRRFQRAVVVSAQPGLSSSAERAARRDADGRFVRMLREQGLAAFVDAWEALPLWESQRRLSETARQAQRAQRLRHDAAGLTQSLLQHGLGEMPDLRPFLATVETQVELVAGEHDDKFVKLNQELVSVLPHAHLTIVPGVGHNVPLENSAAVAQLLLQGSPSS